MCAYCIGICLYTWLLRPHAVPLAHTMVTTNWPTAEWYRAEDERNNNETTVWTRTTNLLQPCVDIIYAVQVRIAVTNFSRISAQY